MATHKELSNFTHDRLSKCNHIDLEIAELKASLTVKQSNQLVPQAIFDKIKDLCIKLSVVIKQDALTISGQVSHGSINSAILFSAACILRESICLNAHRTPMSLISCSVNTSPSFPVASLSCLITSFSV